MLVEAHSLLACSGLLAWRRAPRENPLDADDVVVWRKGQGCTLHSGPPSAVRVAGIMLQSRPVNRIPLAKCSHMTLAWHHHMAPRSKARTRYCMEEALVVEEVSSYGIVMVMAYMHGFKR